MSYCYLCHLRADCPAWATVPLRGHFSRAQPDHDQRCDDGGLSYYHG